MKEKFTTQVRNSIIPSGQNRRKSSL